MKNIFSRIVFSSLFALIVASPLHAFADASLFIAPASGSYKVGELFSVLVNLNTGGDNVNVASAVINFDNSRLEVRDMGYSRSIFSIWTEEPTFSNSAGVIRFSGGLPSPGFNGSAGAIVRVTFKTIAEGQAPVVFSSGSVLANDGKGTNIADSLRGALYTVAPQDGVAPATPIKKPTIVQPAESELFERTDQPISSPIITEAPKQLEEGDVLTIKGLGLPNSKIYLYFQKGSEEPEIREIFGGPDGRFTYTYDSEVLTGFYRVWGRNVTASGATSDSSEPIIIEVIKPLFFRVGSLALNYTSIVVTLAALVLFLLFMMLLIWRKIRVWQGKRGKEISEAEKAVHEGFDRLKAGVDDYVRYIKGGKTPKGIARRESRVRKEVRKGIEDIEQKIEKEIKDIPE